MRTTVSLSIPAELKQWVDHRVREGGFESAGEFLRDMIRRARDRDVCREIDADLVRRVEEGANVAVDQQDWAAIRRAAKRAATRRRSGR